MVVFTQFLLLSVERVLLERSSGKRILTDQPFTYEVSQVEWDVDELTSAGRFEV